MNSEKSEHDIVVEKIIESNSDKFTILSNLGGEQHYIAQIFPDLIFLNKENNKPIFIIEVKRNGNIATCMQQWKTVSSIPATLYIVVPESDLPSAKSIAQVIGLQTRFGSYKFDNINQIIVNFE